MSKINHFGIIVSEGKCGYKLTRELYALTSKMPSLPMFDSVEACYITKENDGNREKGWKISKSKNIKYKYTQEWCNKRREKCLENYDLNMKFMSLLHKKIFCKEIDEFLKKHPYFESVVDLNDYEGECGYYIMVLDNYKQVYVGTSGNICKRIKQHWTRNKSFDRLLFPVSVNESKLSIDSFRVLDTTRIYAYRTSDTFDSENDFIEDFSPEFQCNRMMGGILKNGLLDAIRVLKTRNL